MKFKLVTILCRKLRITPHHAERLLESSKVETPDDLVRLFKSLAECGFSQKSLKKMFLQGSFSLDMETSERVLKHTSILACQGLSKKEAASVISEQPEVFAGDSTQKLKSTIEILQKNLSGVQIGRLLSKDPFLLPVCNGDTLGRALKFLKGFGFSSSTIEEMALHFPRLLSSCEEKEMQSTTIALIKIFKEETNNVIVSCPQLIVTPSKNISAMHDALLQFIRWGPRYTTAMLIKSPELLMKDPAKIPVISDLLKSVFRWPPSDVRSFVRKHPKVLLFESEEDLTKVITFLCNELQTQPRDIERCIHRNPAVLLLDPEHDIKPRFELLSALNVSIPRSKIPLMLSCGDDEFAEKFARISLEEFQDYLCSRRQNFSITGGDID